MKKLHFLPVLLLFSLSGQSQGILTYKDNCILAGDSILTQEIRYMPPGNPGENQIWDFSRIQFIADNPATQALQMPPSRMEGLGNANLLLNDHGYEYYLKSDETHLEELGLMSKDYSFAFSDPMLKMKYPFAYGENFIDNYNGVGSYRGDRKVEVYGKYSVTADGFGTLILPDRILKDAMRLRIEETGIQINPCNSIERKIIRYLWYVPFARHAVLGFTDSEYAPSGEIPKITYSGFINPKMCAAADDVLINNHTSADLTGSSVVLFPNPFSKVLSYNYFLRKQMQVSIELLDMAGRRSLYLLDNQQQSEGLHTGELDADAYNLNMGVYYLRFTFGKTVVVNKVVKM